MGQKALDELLRDLVKVYGEQGLRSVLETLLKKGQVITAEEAARGVNREAALKWARSERRSGRPAKVEPYIALVRQAGPEEAKELLERAKQEMGRTSYWELRKKLKEAKEG